MTTRSIMQTRRLAGTGAAALATAVVAGLLLRDVTPPLDRWVLDTLRASPGSAAAGVATAISGIGTLLCLAGLVAGAVAVWRRHRAAATEVLLRSAALGVLSASVLMLQNVVLRPGPPQQPQLSTYPSGHATIVTAIALTAVVLYGVLGPRWRTAAVAAGAILVVLVSASRVVLAEHWLVDVAGAIVATVGVGMLVLAALRPGRPQAAARR